VAATGLVSLAQAPAPGHPAPPPVAVKVLQLFDQLRVAEAANARGLHQHVAFRLSDAEINEYMRYSLSVTPRPGLDSLTVKVFPANYISTLTIIDFDAVERWHPGTIPSVLHPVLKGKKSILVDYRIHAQDSKVTFSVEKAYYQDVHIPAFIFEKVIAIVAARQPEKYDTSKPMPIPFGLRQLWTSDHVIEGQN
jgi:hypothetical protein